MISGINHLTLSVSDLERSFTFYTELLGLKPVAKWLRGAYLTAGDDWVCLTLDEQTREGPSPEYTHFAFSVDESSFTDFAEIIREGGLSIWKEDESEGDSLYFLDPDGHKLEIHTGDLASRLNSLRQQPFERLRLYD